MADKVNPTLARGGSEGGTDDDGKEVFYGSVPGKEMTATYGFYYADGSVVPPSKLVNNAIAAEAANAGSDVGFGPGVSPAQAVYGKTLSGDTGLTVLKEDAPTYGDATYDPVNKIVIVRDFNGTSIYNEKGMLISGRGSVNRIGVAKGSAGLGAQIDINGVGAYGTPEYNRNIANAAKQNLAFAGSDLQKQAFATLGTTATATPVTTKTGNISTGQPTETFLNAATTGTGSGAPNNPYVPGTEEYKDFNERRSAYDLLFQEFDRYGLGTLVTPLRDLITEGVSPSEFSIRLTQTEPYKQRFAANQARISKGLAALSPAAYIGLEDQYQDIMRRYGLPDSYYSKNDIGVQEGFNKLIANDVSNVELEDRISTAQNRVVNSDPEIANTLKQFYPGISNGDILAYVLDPANALDKIKRKVTAAEIGTAAKAEGLTTGVSRAEQLATAGISKEQAQQGFQTVAAVAPRGGMLADIYKQSPYTQTTAETEIFGLGGASSAAAQRKKLTELEQGAFSGRSGTGAIARDRAGSI